jgi:hypothetical protein
MVAILARQLLRLQESRKSCSVLHMEELQPSGTSIGLVIARLAQIQKVAKSSLAKTLGISETTLWRSLSGERSFTTEELDALGAALGGLRASRILAIAEEIEMPLMTLLAQATSSQRRAA